MCLVTFFITEGSSLRSRRSGTKGLLSEAAGHPVGGGRRRGDGEDRPAGEVERAPGTSDWSLRVGVCDNGVSFWTSFTRLIQECEQKRKKEKKDRRLSSIRMYAFAFEGRRRKEGKFEGRYFERFIFFSRSHLIVYSRRLAWDARCRSPVSA